MKEETLTINGKCVNHILDKDLIEREFFERLAVFAVIFEVNKRINIIKIDSYE